MLTALAGFLAVAATRYGEHFCTFGNWVLLTALLASLLYIAMST